MKVKVICFTKKGLHLANKLKDFLDCDISLGFGENKINFKLWTEQNFKQNNALIFIGATGICIRSIAPFVKSKLTDPCVLVLDDNGKFCIPILSGHIGKGNDLALLISNIIDSTPVITTATDVNNVFAVDNFAVKNNLAIINAKNIKNVSAKLLNGEIVYFKSDFEVLNLPKNVMLTDTNYDFYITYKNVIDENILILCPKILNVGVGCRKDKESLIVTEHIKNVFDSNDLNVNSIKNFASIDIKKDELAILNLKDEFMREVLFFTSEQLNEVLGDFTDSDFVKKITGTSNVCERSAKILGGDIIVKKSADSGVTVAISKENFICDFSL